MPTPTATHIFVADDHPLFRAGIRFALSQYTTASFHVCGEAANGIEAIQAISLSPPDVVLMDVSMPEMDGIEATAILKKRFPRVAVIGLSLSDESEPVLAMVNAGCDGYLLKDVKIDELALAVKTVCGGVTYFTPAVTRHLTAQLRHPAERSLTTHEKQIVQMVCDGSSNQDIASALHVSKRTIETNRQRIMKKAGVKNIVGLLRYAIKKRLFKP